MDPLNAARRNAFFKTKHGLAAPIEVRMGTHRRPDFNAKHVTLTETTNLLGQARFLETGGICARVVVPVTPIAEW
jgi:hypothetical protein